MAGWKAEASSKHVAGKLRGRPNEPNEFIAFFPRHWHVKFAHATAVPDGPIPFRTD